MTKIKNLSFPCHSADGKKTTRSNNLLALSPNQGERFVKHNVDFVKEKRKVSNDISIDSLKLRIPLSMVKILDDSLLKEYDLVSFSDEVLDSYSTFKNQALPFSENGIKTKFKIEKQSIDGKRVADFLTILLNSKALGEYYLEGITLSNVEKVYNYIISLGVVSFKIGDFLDGECTDIDFKKDQYLEMYKFGKVINRLKKGAKKTSQREKGFRPTKKAKNKGIEFSTRRFATPANRYGKIYHKQLELENNSIEFYNKYIKDNWVIEDLVRTEITMKNKKFFKFHNIEDTSFNSLLRLDQCVLKSFFSKFWITQMEINKSNGKDFILPDEKNKKLTGKDRLIVNSIIYIIKKENIELTYNDIEKILIGATHYSKVQKSRDKSKLKALYDEYIKDGKLGKQVTGISDFLNEVGFPDFD